MTNPTPNSQHLKPPPPTPSKSSNEPSNTKNKTKRRPWPEKRRAQQAINCRHTKPEQRATGPKTAAGKAASSQNALKHGLRSAEIIRLRKLLRKQAAYIKMLGEIDMPPLPPHT